MLRRGNHSPLSFPLFKGVFQKMYKLAKEAIIQRKAILRQKHNKSAKGEELMAYKEYREMKVYESNGYQYKRTPCIVLKGKWLSELGFDIGEQIEVKCEGGRLIIEKKYDIFCN